MSRKRIKGILHNFLGTYTSRYTDFEGYWLFGMLVGEIQKLEINLLHPNIESTAAKSVAAAIRIAGQTFREQLYKADIDVSEVQEASIEIIKMAAPQKGVVNGRVCNGNDLRCVVKLAPKGGKEQSREISVFVAPHDSAVERRSLRAFNHIISCS